MKVNKSNRSEKRSVEKITEDIWNAYRRRVCDDARALGYGFKGPHAHTLPTEEVMQRQIIVEKQDRRKVADKVWNEYRDKVPIDLLDFRATIYADLQAKGMEL